jgi:hypothetical protein
MSKVAIAAILLGSLMPALTHALGASKHPVWVEVCSAAGSKWISLEGTEGKPLVPARDPRQTSAHCADCTLNGGSPGLPPAPFAWDMVTPAAVDRQRLRPLLPQGKPGWDSALARAPPQPT